MFKSSCVAVALLSTVFLCGCGGSSAPATSQPAAVADAPKIPIPPDSPFAKIKPGMGYDEVVATIGPPSTEPYIYQTGKAWIPYNFGGDKYRKRAHWKGLGAITFSSNSSFTTSMSVLDPDGLNTIRRIWDLSRAPRLFE